jgi:hypothetical protein
VVYPTTLSVAHYKRRVVGWSLNDGLEVIWTGAVVSSLNVPSWNSRGGTKENYGKPQDSGVPDSSRIQVGRFTTGAIMVGELSAV